MKVHKFGHWIEARRHFHFRNMAVKDKASVFLYAVLVWIRWIASTGSGYIHPDEYFQNPEITSRIVFGIESFVPWEFTAEHAARSIVPPYVIAISNTGDCKLLTVFFQVSLDRSALPTHQNIWRTLG